MFLDIFYVWQIVPCANYKTLRIRKPVNYLSCVWIGVYTQEIMDQQNQNVSEFDPSQFVESFVGVGRELLLRPRSFFQHLPRKGGFKNPFFFLFICNFLSSLFMATFLKGDYNIFFALLSANIISALLGSLLIHGLATRIFGGQALFTATFRIIAYASLMDIVAGIPVLGFIASFYGLYLIFIGLQEIHQLKPRQAGTTILIITIMLLCMGILAADMLQNSLQFPAPDL